MSYREAGFEVQVAVCTVNPKRWKPRQMEPFHPTLRKNDESGSFRASLRLSLIDSNSVPVLWRFMAFHLVTSGRRAGWGHKGGFT